MVQPRVHMGEMGKTMNNNGTDRIDEKLDELLSELRSGTINFDADAKQAIKQFIASELNKRLNAHYADGLGTYDYDGIAESMIEWMGELKGEGK